MHNADICVLAMVTCAAAFKTCQPNRFFCFWFFWSLRCTHFRTHINNTRRYYPRRDIHKNVTCWQPNSTDTDVCILCAAVRRVKNKYEYISEKVDLCEMSMSPIGSAIRKLLLIRLFFGWRENQILWLFAKNFNESTTDSFFACLLWNHWLWGLGLWYQKRFWPFNSLFVFVTLINFYDQLSKQKE